MVVDLAALGAFLSGAASVIGGIYVIKAVRRHDDHECEKRFEAFREGLRHGREEKP